MNPNDIYTQSILLDDFNDYDSVAQPATACSVVGFFIITVVIAVILYLAKKNKT